VLSLLLCVATAALWARSYWLTDRVDWANAGGWRGISTARGRVEVGFLRTNWSAYPQEFHGPRYQRDVAHVPFNWILLMGGSAGDVTWSAERAGFAWHERRNRSRGSLHAIAIAPFWSLAIVTAALPAARAAMRRRHAGGLQSGHCPACGYDLTGNVSGLCPECGTKVVATTGRRSRSD
jgi:hypothetical protein